jgi:RNA polymerase-binding transcription factor DksA
MAATKKKSDTKKIAGKKATGSAATKAQAGSKKTSKTASAKAAAKRSPKKTTALVEPSPPPAAKVAPARPAVPRTPKVLAPEPVEPPKPRFNKAGIGYTRDFDLTFVTAQYVALQAERIRLTGQANRLEEEAHQLVEEAEMGDVQFDDEGGEGDTMVVERERDLALSAQAREAVVEIDEALARIAEGLFGYSVLSGRPLPRERLEAIPWASVLVEEKVGGIGR